MNTVCGHHMRKIETHHSLTNNCNEEFTHINKVVVCLYSWYLFYIHLRHEHFNSHAAASKQIPCIAAGQDRSFQQQYHRDLPQAHQTLRLPFSRLPITVKVVISITNSKRRIIRVDIASGEGERGLISVPSTAQVTKHGSGSHLPSSRLAAGEAF